jgi:Holliday junction resolvase RusA-like endonuclease
MQVTFEVPWKPVSVNHYWEVTMYRDRLGYPHRGRKLSKEAVAWKQAVAIFSKGLTVAPEDERERKKARYRVKVIVYLAYSQRGDADNFAKCCMDGLQSAGVIHSDAYIADCNIVVDKDHRSDPRSPRTVFYVERMEN